MQATRVERAGGSESPVDLRPQRLLWIDDQIASGDAAVSLLSLHGFDVECAQTGLDGLRKATKDPHAGIILDLRLPDMPGLAVLQRLVADAIEAPVLVLTGFADHHSAVAAIKLGAVDYKSKPLLDDELLQAVRRLVCEVSPNHAHDDDRPGHRRTQSISALDETARRLATPTIAVLEFVLLARSFRRLVGDSNDHRRIETMRPYCTPEETAFATDLLGNLARVLSEGMLPTLDDVAHETAVPAEHINHILKILAHSSFLECRRALRVRPTVSEVALSHEQMAQIAYRHRYQWPGQFDRDFKATLLLTPNEFRRLFFARAFVARDRS